MHQAILTQEDSKSAPHAAAATASRATTSFVINLCSSTTPVALTPPDHAGLKRFTFFVSRRREEGRERFRLHMGYFASQEEAEKLLDIVREIYPGAWAGNAPGLALRARASTSAGAQLPEATPVPPRTAPPPAAATATATAPAPKPAPPSVPPPTPELALLPDAGRRPPPPAPEPAGGTAAASSLSNVRATIAALEDSAAAAPTVRPIPELQPAATAASGIHRAPIPRAAEPAPISDATALQVLEGAAAEDAPTLRQPRPPTPIRSAARSAPAPRAQDEAAQYAVQLMWSVKPIDIGQVPRLAIFSAYTLYGAEGNRDGRRWYGIRLGFFTDAVSAKQVAHYVRSDFATVSVVPVTVRERERAKIAATRPPSAPATAAPAEAPKEKPVAFEFIDDRQQGAEGAALRADGSPSHSAAPATPPTRAPRRPGTAPGKRAKLRPAGSRIDAKTPTKPLTLEETLEILGAGQLQVDDGRSPLINDSGVRHLQVEGARSGKGSALSRLFERLAERLGT